MTENLYGKSRRELEEILSPWSDRPFHARQLFGWIHRRGETDFSRMTDLPGRLRVELAERFHVSLPRVEQRQVSRDGAVKYLLRLQDGKGVEAVYLPEKTRATLCISSQIGCPLGCTFCLTARVGLVRNLTPGENVGRVAGRAGAHGGSPTGYNLVFMGMGEPLNNYDSVLEAFRIMTDEEGLGIAPRHITLSTAGGGRGTAPLAGGDARARG